MTKTDFDYEDVITADLDRARRKSLDIGAWVFDDYEYHVEANDVAFHLREGRSVAISVEPENGTRYSLALTPWRFVHIAPMWPLLIDEDSILVAVLGNHRCAPMRRGYTDERYVREKLDVNRSDAVVIAAFLNAVWSLW